ncbi:Glycogen phosphorylase [Poriferisphaera corsica]|uniref:Glycogen phosphorylase n=1 Tax=Poriferisphaera corsica TaxID=2528020 RepID=A0A517YUT6_9BACT|nr:alpha-glucan family phosphorylase [Poriferisphaera corsica]QDU33994.1 Glycogen phosphorylase [Poriferisphaera corsica]
MTKAAQTKRQQQASIQQIADQLCDIASNFWWTWNSSAQRLFAAIDPMLWEATERNPLQTIKQAPDHRLLTLASDEAFLKNLKAVQKQFADYMKSKTWFDRTVKGKDKKARIAYFCAEFAIHESFPIYSGGLGVLAGDHLKSASDLGIPLTAVGLMYRHGYYRQEIEADGSTKAVYPEYDFNDFPIEDTGIIVPVPVGRRRIHAKVWLAKVGRIEAYLLDTDIEENTPKDREITHFLYGGDNETRIRQELILGVGGTLALQALDIEPTVYHLNEGHAAFNGLHRFSELLKEGVPSEEAMETVRAGGCFTTHTPVPAGHDRFDVKMARKYLSQYAGEDTGLSVNDVLQLGSEDLDNKNAPFCMTVLALNFCERANGVAELHGDTSRRMWIDHFGLSDPDEVPIGHVTNGIHSQTWLAPEIEPLYTKYLKPNWASPNADSDWWKKADKIPADVLWNTRKMLRTRLIRFVRERLVQQAIKHGQPLEDIVTAQTMLDENTLTIGFARRFATYKRAPLIFHDMKRLKAIIASTDRPVQFVFAGKAHPADKDGQKYLQQIVEFSKQPGFRGRIAVIENYDMQVGRMLTSGVDVWLNNPLRPMEASGTSGMKPPLHGGINCSILDGWWPESYNKKNGYAIGGKQFDKQSEQDTYDANSFYDILEKQMLPTFYKTNKEGVATKWVDMMEASMKTVCAQFSTHRMLGDYTSQYYLPAHRDALKK